MRSPLGNGNPLWSSSEGLSAAAGKVYPREPCQAFSAQRTDGKAISSQGISVLTKLSYIEAFRPCLVAGLSPARASVIETVRSNGQMLQSTLAASS